MEGASETLVIISVSPSATRGKPMTVRKLGACVLLAALALGACGGKSNGTASTNTTPKDTSTAPTAATAPTASTNNAPDAGKVTQAEFGDDWPFTVAEGTVRCVDISSVVFDAGGKTYALSGTAQSQTDFPDVDPIWAADPTIPGAKKNIGLIIDKGLTLCPK